MFTQSLFQTSTSQDWPARLTALCPSRKCCSDVRIKAQGCLETCLSTEHAPLVSHCPEDPARSPVSPAHVYVHTLPQQAPGRRQEHLAAGDSSLPSSSRLHSSRHCMSGTSLLRAAASPDSEICSSSVSKDSLKTKPLLAETPAVKGTPRVKSQMI